MAPVDALRVRSSRPQASPKGCRSRQSPSFPAWTYARADLCVAGIGQIVRLDAIEPLYSTLARFPPPLVARTALGLPAPHPLNVVSLVEQIEQLQQSVHALLAFRFQLSIVSVSAHYFTLNLSASFLRGLVQSQSLTTCGDWQLSAFTVLPCRDLQCRTMPSHSDRTGSNKRT